MEDVELLVGTFYDFSAQYKADQTLEELQQDNEEGKGEGDGVSAAGDAEQDDEILNINQDDIVEILRDFQVKREDRINNAEVFGGNPRNKKRSNFETEEQKKERMKKEERVFWEKMTTILSDSKQSVWKALDKALSQYYSMLVERQNLIEETGLLN